MSTPIHALAHHAILRATGRMIAGDRLDPITGAPVEVAESETVAPGTIFNTTSAELAELIEAGAARRVRPGEEEAALAEWRARQGDGIQQTFAEGADDVF